MHLPTEVALNTVWKDNIAFCNVKCLQAYGQKETLELNIKAYSSTGNKQKLIKPVTLLPVCYNKCACIFQDEVSKVTSMLM